MRHFPKVHTPWGQGQSAETKADGIVFYSTASHGGYRLSPEREAARQKRFPLFTTYAGGEWYEEDQDCAVVVLTFPELYADDELRAAVRTARLSAQPFDFGQPGAPQIRTYPQWESVVAWLDGNSLTAQGIRDRVARFEAENGDKWEAGSMSSHAQGYPDRCWSVSFTRVGDGQRKWVVITGYTQQRFYTDEELAAVTAQPLPPKQPKYTPPKFREEECGGTFDGFSVTSDADPGL